MVLEHCSNEGCGVEAGVVVGVVMSRWVLGGVGVWIGVGVGFLTTLGVGFFVRLPLRMCNWIIFYITLLNWKFLLKWYNFYWNFCWNRDFLPCTTISIDFNSQISFFLCSSRGWESESEILERPEWKLEILEGSELELESDILPPTPQPWF